MMFQDRSNGKFELFVGPQTMQFQGPAQPSLHPFRVKLGHTASVLFLFIGFSEQFRRVSSDTVSLIGEEKYDGVQNW